jgi:hypothetical protein
VAWETRSSDRQYFYLSERLSDGRIRKKYIGTGLLAEVESLWLERKAAVRRQLSEERQQTLAAESLLKQHLRSTTDVTHALMLSMGYTNERSRGWRRRTMNMIAPNDVNNEIVPVATEDDEPSFPELVKAARQGDRTVIPALRRMLRANPDLAKNNGDLASQTQIHWIDLIAGKDLYRRECLLMKMAELKRELLAESNGTVVEEMLVDQAVSTWLQVYYHEDREATRPAENIQLGEYRLKKIESAFNRHMRSLSALASMKSINFTDRMAQTMMSVTQDSDREQRNLCSPPVSRTNGNRLSHSFSRSFEPIPMN